MPETEVLEFGRIKSPADLPDMRPIEFTLYGYDVTPDAKGEHKEHAFKFLARGTEPTGAMLDVYATMDASGLMNLGPGSRFIRSVLMPDQMERWDEVVHNGALHFQATAIGDMAQTLLGIYMGKDDGRTLRRVDFRSTPRGTGPTSTAGRGVKASTSRPPRQPKASTSSGR